MNYFGYRRNNNLNNNREISPFTIRINQKKRMTQNEIDQLGIEIYNINNNYSTKNCRICLVEFKNGNKLRRLPCLHIFHKKCIDHWLKDNGKCPIDNVNVELS
jgi:hypothetical protein